MTNTPRSRSARAQRPTRRRVARVAGTAGLAAAALLAAAPVASAEPSASRSDAPAIARAAEGAIGAFERWQLTGDPIDFLHYADERRETAEATADELGVDPAELRSDLSSAPMASQRAVLAAMSQLGTAYRRLGDSPDEGFDCSGLTSWSYAEAGIDLPRSSGAQIGDAERVDADEALPGALVHYPGHVGLYVGAGLYVHSPYTGSTVEVTDLPDRSLSFGSVDDG